MDARLRIDEELYELEVIDGEFVDPEIRDLTMSGVSVPDGPYGSSLARPAAARLHTAAAAATGFVAGAATLALLRRYASARTERAVPPVHGSADRGLGGPPERVITYLVQVRPLTRPE